MNNSKTRFKVLVLVFGIVLALAGGGIYVADIDTDITRFLPTSDPVLSDAAAIFNRHPMRDRIVIDLALEKEDRNLLLQSGRECEAMLEKSGLFKEVGLKSFQSLMPPLIDHILSNLPVLFAGKELETEIDGLIRPESLEPRFREMRRSLLDLDGIGQSAHMAKDPLGLKNLVLARLASLSPTPDARIEQGKLLSPDGKHLLILATPSASGTDTAFARSASAELEKISDTLSRTAVEKGNKLVMTPSGAYRAALDNETIIRKDVNRAIVLATIGIAVLLLFAFHRPFLGLLAFLPALAGTAAAFFVCALWFDTLSIMALGFGGAVVSITVDHGIAYLLFLDQPREVRGEEASEKIRSVGLIATLTTMGAFALLCFSAFPVFRQLGLFTALGIGFSYVFVHTVFPKLIPVMPPAKPRRLLLRKAAPFLSSGGRNGALAALAVGIAMLFFARPEFDSDLRAMNTVGRETAAAEALMTEVWGEGVFGRIFLMAEGDDPRALQAKGDDLLQRVEADIEAGTLGSAFVPSMIFPGEERRKANFAAWSAFWTPERVLEFKGNLAVSASAAGFKPDAFEPFFNTLSMEYERFDNQGVPNEFFELSGIRENNDGTGWSQFSMLSPGPSYDAEDFYEKYRGAGRVFDADLFSERMGNLLFSNFTKLLGLIGAGVALLIFGFLLDLKLTAMSLGPVVFAMVCSLGTMKLLGHPLDIPGLMLSIVVFGMGVDYSLFLVRAYQRQADESHPDTVMIETSVFMAAASTLIGFGVLLFSEHSLLKSAGLTSLLGIAYSSTGAFLILPPLLSFYFHRPAPPADANAPLADRILRRYRRRETYPRLFARYKLKYDTMFPELPAILKNSGKMDRLLDVGCGYGVPAAWLAETFRNATVHGFDPDRERVRIAALALGERGMIQYGCAPEIPAYANPMDAVFMLDIVHFLTDEGLERTLEKLARRLRPGGKLIVRAVVPSPNGNFSKTWRLESLKMKIAGVAPTFRTAERIGEMIGNARFTVEFTGLSGNNEESVWFVSRLASQSFE